MWDHDGASRGNPLQRERRAPSPPREEQERPTVLLLCRDGSLRARVEGILAKTPIRVLAAASDAEAEWLARGQGAEIKLITIAMGRDAGHGPSEALALLEHCSGSDVLYLVADDEAPSAGLDLPRDSCVLGASRLADELLPTVRRAMTTSL